MTNINLESTKQLILAEINTAPEPAFLQEVLHFIRFLKEQYRIEDAVDIADAEAVLQGLEHEGTISPEPNSRAAHFRAFGQELEHEGTISLEQLIQER